jgi:negative regulator of genetic competence, sporulation and motility
MEIQAGINGKISVTLTKKDLQDLDITYDELDYSNIETRRVIWTILDKARLALGKSITLDNRLLINAIPINDGGCCLEFTQLPCETETTKAKTVLKKGDEPILFCSFDLNAFLDCVKQVKLDSQRAKEVSYYIYENAYYIIIYPEAQHTKCLLLQLCEYGDASLAPPKAIAEICEGGKKLS